VPRTSRPSGVEWPLKVARLALSAPPPGCGQIRAAHVLHRRYLHTSKRSRRTLARVPGGATVALDLTDRIQAETWLTGTYSSSIVRFVSSQLREGSIFVDAGAHIGLVTLQVAGLAASQPRIHAFEPHPVNHSSLAQNVSLNPQFSIVTNCLAVGSTAKRAWMSSYGSEADSSGHHFLTPGEPRSETEWEVDVTTLDAYATKAGLDEIQVVKLDLEGYELTALQGATRLLADHRIGCVVAEVSDDLLHRDGSTRKAVCEFMERLDYVVHDIPPVGAQRLRRNAYHRRAADLAFKPRAS
jgi:FkbM family methyltransferase